jgi:hypothetical protein
MGKHDGYRMLALRVQNMTRSCILLKQYNNGIWTMPVVTIPSKDDAAEHLHEVFQHVQRGDGFEFISAVSILEWVQEDSKDVEHHSIIYDMKYTGKVLGTMTEADRGRFVKSQWVQKGMLDRYKGDANYPLYAYINAMEKEKCLA